MPQGIKNIDKISREKGRDVLFLEFHPKLNPEAEGERAFELFDYENNEIRKTIIKWFEENNIGFMKCAGMTVQGGAIVMECYNGQLYIDVPFDDNDPNYIKVRDFLEYPDGTVKFEGLKFYNVPYILAMKLSYTDDPDFWDDF